MAARPARQAERESVIGREWSVSLALFAQELIAWNIVLQDMQGIGSQSRQAHQLELQQQTRRRLAAAGGEPLDDDAADPAARVVLQADDRIGEPAVECAVVDPADAVERAAATAAARRPLAAIAALSSSVDRPLPA